MKVVLFFLLCVVCAYSGDDKPTDPCDRPVTIEACVPPLIPTKYKACAKIQSNFVNGKNLFYSCSTLRATLPIWGTTALELPCIVGGPKKLPQIVSQEKLKDLLNNNADSTNNTECPEEVLLNHFY